MPVEAVKFVDVLDVPYGSTDPVVKVGGAVT
jgi:hypothetical protein